jgi:hypothetical protein
MNTIETTPEPLPVVVSEKKCPVHGLAFVSMPRNESDRHTYIGLAWKCVWVDCLEGM